VPATPWRAEGAHRRRRTGVALPLRLRPARVVRAVACGCGGIGWRLIDVKQVECLHSPGGHASRINRKQEPGVDDGEWQWRFTFEH
jgi:hypothetical protein